MDLSLIHSVIVILQQHQPWLADKLGGALATQTVRELWDQVKRKLGPSETEKVERSPDDPGKWEVFKGKLLTALEEDPAFAKKIRELVTLAERNSAAISQTANGTDIQQIGVSSSKDVKISVK